MKLCWAENAEDGATRKEEKRKAKEEVYGCGEHKAAAMSLSNKTKNKKNAFGATAPPFIDYLKEILRRYPDGGQILKELVQNADDAGASNTVFIHDERRYGTNSVWSEALGKYQEKEALVSLLDQPLKAFHDNGCQCYRAVVVQARWIGVFWHWHNGGAFKASGNSCLGKRQVEDVSKDPSKLLSTCPDESRDVVRSSGFVCADPAQCITDICEGECDWRVISREFELCGNFFVVSHKASIKVIKLIQKEDISGSGLDALPHASRVRVGKMLLYLLLVAASLMPLFRLALDVL
ncbi:sacsin [Silurus meridionalis]|nr:sacsin [Silurus meridionalis]